MKKGLSILDARETFHIDFRDSTLPRLPSRINGGFKR